MGIANQMLSSCHFVQTGEKPLHWQLELIFLSFPFSRHPCYSLEHNHQSLFVLHFIFHFCLEINLWPSCAVCFSSFSVQHCLLFSLQIFFFFGVLSNFFFFFGKEIQCARFVSALNYCLQLSQNGFIIPSFQS